MLQTSTALIHDGVMILAEALKQIGVEHLKVGYDPDIGRQEIDCDDPNSIWSKGYTITNYMKNVRFNLITCFFEILSLDLEIVY